MAAAAGPLPPDVNKGSGILISSWIEAAIGLVAVALRMYTRSKTIRNVGWDDWTMVLAMVSSSPLRYTLHHSSN